MFWHADPGTDDPGDYLAATALPELTGPPHHRANGALLLGVATAVGATVMFGAAFVVARRQRRRAD